MARDNPQKESTTQKANKPNQHPENNEHSQQTVNRRISRSKQQTADDDYTITDTRYDGKCCLKHSTKIQNKCPLVATKDNM